MTKNKLIRDEFEFGSLFADILSELGDIVDYNAGNVGKFKEEFKLDEIVKLVGLRPLIRLHYAKRHNRIKLTQHMLSEKRHGIMGARERTLNAYARRLR